MLNPVTPNLPDGESAKPRRAGLESEPLWQEAAAWARSAPALASFVVVVASSFLMKLLTGYDPGWTDSPVALMVGPLYAVYWFASVVWIVFFLRFHWRNLRNRSRPIWKRLGILVLGIGLAVVIAS